MNFQKEDIVTGSMQGRVWHILEKSRNFPKIPKIFPKIQKKGKIFRKIPKNFTPKFQKTFP